MPTVVGGDIPYPAYTFPEYDTPMPNPLGILKKIPKKIVSGIIRLMKLDRIILEIFLVMLSIPDEKLNDFLVKKLTNIFQRAEKPLKEIAEKIGKDVLEPIFKAIPGMNILYIINDIQRAQKAVTETQIPALNVVKDIVQEASKFTEDVTGPARGLSSMILGLSEYLENVKKGGDINDVYRIYNETGSDVNGEVSRDSNKRMAARLLATKMIHDVATEIKEGEKGGFPLDARELMEKYKGKLDAIISKETKNYLLGENEQGFLDLLLNILGGDSTDTNDINKINTDNTNNTDNKNVVKTQQTGSSRKRGIRRRLKNKTRKYK
jgi:hypothetical protein